MCSQRWRALGVQSEPVFRTILMQNWLFWRNACGLGGSGSTTVISSFLFWVLLPIKPACHKEWVQLLRPGMKNECVSFQNPQDTPKCPCPLSRTTALLQCTVCQVWDLRIHPGRREKLAVSSWVTSGGKKKDAGRETAPGELLSKPTLTLKGSLLQLLCG